MEVQPPESCALCPRRCGADRRTGTGRCGGGPLPRVARAALHLWEEPCLVGEKGSGAVFFSGCPLGCSFCQNQSISRGNFGREVTTERLSGIFLELQAQGAANINLVTAGHYIPWVAEALRLAGEELMIPVVWNSGGYESVETVDTALGFTDVFMPDLKFMDSGLSERYCGASDYFQVASAALKRIFYKKDWTKEYCDGILKKGTVIRHMVMPGSFRDSIHILDWLAANLPVDKLILSLMSQYTPPGKPDGISPERRISSYEYRKVTEHAAELGFTGFMQERSSADAEYTPDFDLTGV